jgi:hypothetical protein
VSAWGRTLPWWGKIDRAEIILEARSFAGTGGFLTLYGPSGYGHIEAACFVADEMSRTGWQCHDLSVDGPSDVADVAIRGLESIFPTAPGGVPQRAQVSGINRTALRGYFASVTSAEPVRHCLIVPYPDREQALSTDDLDFLRRLCSQTISLILLSDGQTNWSGPSGVQAVELRGFLTEHLEAFLAREPRLELVDVAATRDRFQSLEAGDGRIIPAAAYTLVQQLAREVQGNG